MSASGPVESRAAQLAAKAVSMTILLQARGLSLFLPTGRRLLESTDLVLDRRIVALVGANGSGKSHLCRALAGLDPVEEGSVRISDGVAFADARALPERARLGQLLPDDPASQAMVAAFGLDRLDPMLPVAALSGGERQRLALVRALAEPAALLILDEPAAHLDADTRALLAERLRRHRGGVLMVSHERELLALAQRVLELSQQRLHDYPLDFDAYRGMREREQAQAARDLDLARRELRQQRERAQRNAERASARAGQGERARRKGSHGAMYFDFVAGNAEAGAGRRQRQAQQRITAAREGIEAARERLCLDADFDLRLPADPIPAGRGVLHAEGLRITVAERVLVDRLDLDLRGPQRLAIAGANGSGKSLLLRVLAGLREPDGGSLRRAPIPFAFIDQFASIAEPQQDLLDALQQAQPGQPRGEAIQRLAWFGFVDEQLRQPAISLSAGERVRLALACALAGPRVPSLLLLDEPDNHLDLHSLAIVERALAQFRGALVVVSHSEGFLQAISVEDRLTLG